MRLPRRLARYPSPSSTHFSILTISDIPISCTVGTCLYDDAISWFGCCTGTARSECELYTTCVGADSTNSCLSDSTCKADAYKLECTDSGAEVCMTMWGEVQEGTVRHYVCGTASASVQVVATPTAGGDSTTNSNVGLPGSVATSVVSSASDSSISRSSSSTQDRPKTNTAVTATTRSATSAVSTAGALKTAQAVVGAVDGFAGFVAWFV